MWLCFPHNCYNLIDSDVRFPEKISRFNSQLAQGAHFTSAEALL
jgi:hypothetical protein